jgi:hypothetical protein
MKDLIKNLLSGLVSSLPGMLSNLLGGLLSKALTWLLIGGVGLAVLGGIWLHGYHKGADKVRAEWAAAEQRAYENGVQAREKAERSVPPASTPSKPCVVRDPYDRDCK